MKKLIAIVGFAFFLFPSCKKDYNCQCTNSTGSYMAGTVEAKTKWKAKKKCEALTSGATTCGLQ